MATWHNGRKEAERRDVPILEVEQLTKRYGKTTTVNNVALKVYPGEVVGLLGANGAGKTTSFHMICGLISANAGKILLNGKDVTRWPMHLRCKSGLGYLPQERSAFGALTVEQNLYGAMEFFGYSRRERRELCDELLERFELKDYRKRVVGYGGSGGLSGGERRRLEVARSLVSRPKILMLDEPFAACDPDTISKIQKAALELADGGLAILINDHAIANTLKITERAYVINKGRVLCSGGAMDVLCNPEAIHFYFGHEARDNAETIGKAHGYSSEEAHRLVNQAYQEVLRRWPEDDVRARSSTPRRNDEREFADGCRSNARDEDEYYDEDDARGLRRLRRRQTSSVDGRSTRPTSRLRPRRLYDDVPDEPGGVEQDRDNAEEREMGRRRRLTLRRDRSSSTPERAPSPRDTGSEDNRYADRMSGILRRRPRQ